MSTRAARGFALLELVIALAIFAVIGAIAYRGLAAIARTRETIAHESERLAQAQLAIALFERDLRQAVGRPVRNEYGQPEPALVGGRERIELTTHAFASPYGGARAQLARVAYSRDNEGFARAAHATLDRGPNARVEPRVLAASAESLRIRYLDTDGWRDEWPPRPYNENLERLPRAIEVTLGIEGLGPLRRVVDLVETGTGP